MTCLEGRTVADLFTSQTTIPPNGTGSIGGFCPANQVPVGQVSNADGDALATRFVVFLFGNPPGVTLMDDLPDGTHGPPSGISRSVANNTAAPLATKGDPPALPGRQ